MGVVSGLTAGGYVAMGSLSARAEVVKQPAAGKVVTSFSLPDVLARFSGEVVSRASPPTVDSPADDRTRGSGGRRRRGVLGLSKKIILSHGVEGGACVLEAFLTDARVRKSTGMASPGRRAEVTGFSDSSRRRFLFTVRNGHPHPSYFGHLTYPAEYPGSGRVCSDHRRKFLQWLSRRGWSGAWVREWQDRGAAHWHLLCTCLRPLSPRQLKGEKGAWSLQWFKVVGSGDEKHLRAGTRLERIRRDRGALSYAAKYIEKDGQKIPPLGWSGVGRYWGTFGEFRCKPVYVVCGREAVEGSRVGVRWRRSATRGKAKGFRGLRRGLGGVLYAAGAVLQEWVERKGGGHAVTESEGVVGNLQVADRGPGGREVRGASSA